MGKGKIIVIEGIDCSGKETQSQLLESALNDLEIETESISFPNYDSATGKMIGLCYLGEPFIAEEIVMEYYNEVKEKVMRTFNSEVDAKVIKSTLLAFTEVFKHGWFSEKAINVNPLAASLLFSADRIYNVSKINEKINNGINVIIDRYTYSNMAHQGAKIADEDARKKYYEWIYNLEFNDLKLPNPDITLFLDMPAEYSSILKSMRDYLEDEHETDKIYVKSTEKCFKEIANLYNLLTINPLKKESLNPVIEDIKTPEEINEEICTVICKELKLK